MRESGEVDVLHVDDDPDFLELSADMLEREEGRLSVETATSASRGLNRLATDDFDCIVSDYQMPEQNGIEFLETIREGYPDLPFILFTGKGSETVASDAVSAGATDYLQKGADTGQYELLATRIMTAVGGYRAERALERRNDLLEKSQNLANVGAWEYNPQDQRAYFTDMVYEIYGVEPDYEPAPEKDIQEFYHPDDRDTVRTAIEEALRSGKEYDIEVRITTPDGTDKWIRTRGTPQVEDGTVRCVRGTIQDITERKEHERELQRQVDRLAEFTGVVSHDLRNPLNMAQGYIHQARADRDSTDLRTAAEALERIESIIEDTLTLARQGQTVADKTPVPISDVVDRCWTIVDTDTADLRLVDEFTLRGDRNRLLQIFENLFHNAVEHASGPESATSEDHVRHSPTSRGSHRSDAVDQERTSITVRVGLLGVIQTSTRTDPDRVSGFYVEDDGPGIPPDRRESVFEPGESTRDGGTGFGLAIVKRVAEAHGWTVGVTESADGGARFEFTGVEFIE
jgi:PAS domain S-box-containing protein